MSTGFRRSILRFGGAMLIALGILHLTVTPIIARLIAENIPEAVAVWLTPPMLLNHVVVGLLLLPLGMVTYHAAPAAAAGEHWALFVIRVSAITVAALPLALFILMGTRYFGATPFVVATIMVCVAALTLLAAAFWPHDIHRSGNKEDRQPIRQIHSLR